MKLRIWLIFPALWLGSIQGLYAHGFLIDIDTSHKLQLHSEDPLAGTRSLYEVQAPTHIPGVPSFMGSDHPGFDVDTTNGPNGFAGGESIYFSTVGSVWYTDGSSAPAPTATGANGVTLTISSQETPASSVTVTGNSSSQPGPLIGVWDGTALGAFEHQLQYNFSQTPALLAGAYGFELRLTGFNAANEPFFSSDPFVVVFNNGLTVTAGSNGPFAIAALQLYGAITAVPEPSALMLTFLGIVAAIPFWRRR